MTKTHRILIPALVLATAVIGASFTSMGLTDWYPTIVKPEFTPPDWIFGPVWTVIYILSAISAILFFDRFDKFKFRQWCVNGLFRLNILLNLFWSYIFFVDRQIGIAFIDLVILDLTTLALIILLWPISRLSSALLIPYLCWGSFAAYLNYSFILLNP